MDQRNTMEQEMKIELDQIQNTLESLDAKVTGIRSFLSGNELDKDDKGLVGVVNDLKQRVNRLEGIVTRIFYIGIGMSIPASIGTYELVKAIFLK